MSRPPAEPPATKLPATQIEFATQVLEGVQLAIQQIWKLLAGTSPEKLQDLQATWRAIEAQLQLHPDPIVFWHRVVFFDAVVNAAGLTADAALTKVLPQTQIPPIALIGFPPPSRGQVLELAAAHLPLLPLHIEDGYATVATDLPFFAENVPLGVRAALSSTLGVEDLQFVLVNPQELRQRITAADVRTVYRPMTGAAPAREHTPPPRYPRVSLSGFTLMPDEVAHHAQRLLGVQALRENRIAPVHLGAGLMTLAVSAPLPTAHVSRLKSSLATSRIGLRFVSASGDDIGGLLREAHHADAAAGMAAVTRSLAPVAGVRATMLDSTAIEPITLAEAPDVPPDERAVVVVNNALAVAQMRGASDLMLMCVEDRKNGGLVTRMKVNGVWDYRFEPVTGGGIGAKAILARLKVLSGLGEGQTFEPVDGSLRVRMGERELLFRINICPDRLGECATMRLQDNSVMPQLDNLLMPANVHEAVMGMAHRKFGLVILCGPTGSGKTTTLHAILGQLPAQRLNIITFESPIERDLPHIRQVECDDGTGAYRGPSFSTGARAALRMAPDVCLIGETRDSDTIESLMRLAQSGHRVYTTLHSNSAYDVPARMLDLGSRLTSFTPGVLADTLLGAVSQRLLIVPCSHCAIATPVEVVRAKEGKWLLEEWLVDESGQQVSHVYHQNPQGCSHCRGTGRRGRHAVYELLLVDPEMKELISARAPVDRLAAKMEANGFPRLIENAVRLAAAGKVCWNDVVSYR